MFQRGQPDLVPGHYGRINVSLALFFVPDMPLFFENPKLRSNRGIGWFTGQFGQNFRGRGASQAIDDIHDLSLAPAEARVRSI